MAKFELLADGCVIEEHGDLRIRQQPWAEGFARHLLPPGPYATPRPVAGDWNWLDRKGDPVRAPFMHAGFFLAGIPAAVRRLAGHLPRHQWVALEAMRQVPGFAAFLQQEIGGAGLGFVIACWELAGVKQRAPEERRDLAAAMMSMPRAALLGRLSGHPVRDSLLRALAKAQPMEVTPSLVWLLHGLTSHPEASRSVAALPRVTADLALALTALPPWMQHPSVAAAIARGGSAAAVEAALSPSLRAADAAEHRRVMQSIKGARDWPELRARLLALDHRLRRDEPFPPPPVPGDARLRPITTAAALEREGREMNHCVAGYVSAVRAGDHYIYAWHGRERATVQLSRRYGEWTLVQALGHGNRKLRQETLDAICAVLRAQLPAPGWMVETYVAGVAFHQAAQAIATLRPGQPLLLRRQPDNPYDALAIEVLTPEGLKLGYLPRGANRQPAAMLDVGQPVEARLIEWRGGLYDMRVRLTAAGRPRMAA